MTDLEILTENEHPENDVNLNNLGQASWSEKVCTLNIKSAIWTEIEWHMDQENLKWKNDTFCDLVHSTTRWRNADMLLQSTIIQNRDEIWK